MWKVLWLQLLLPAAAMDLLHERLKVEVEPAGKTSISSPVFQSYMRRENHQGETAEASDADLFRLRLFTDSESGKAITTDMAIATHFCDAMWAPGALALAASLKRAGTRHNLVVMITSDLSNRYQRLLAHVFDKVYVEEPVTPHVSITRAGADCVTLQLRSWQLPYQKVLYMDADMIALKSHDSVLEDFAELSARKDAGLAGNQFNGGMFVLEPSESKFQHLRQLLRHTGPQNAGHGGIQFFLNHAFPSCERRSEEDVGCWKQQFSEAYNKFTRDVDEADLEAEKYASLHYSGDWGATRKPWMSGCLQESDSVTHSANSKLTYKLLDLWMDAFHHISVPAGMADLLHTDCPAEDS